jgi:cobalamin biosynthesis protein CobT
MKLKDQRRLVSPQSVVRNLAGLKSDSFTGFLPVIRSNPKAEHALLDLRAIALRFLDIEFLTFVRPAHSEPAYMLDAGIDAIGYAAFVQSSYRDYPGIHENLRALHEHLVDTSAPDIVNYDLQAFLITLRAARETLPALAAATTALEPLLTDDRIFGLARTSKDCARYLRRISSKGQQFARYLGELAELNEAVAGLLPLLQEEPDETAISYREIRERIDATRADVSRAQPGAGHQDDKSLKRRSSGLRRKPERRGRPKLNYYRPASAAVADRITRGNEFRVWTVPTSIRDLYEQHGLELAKARRSWLRYAKDTWPKKSTMRLLPTDRGGVVFGYLAQKVISPLSNPPEMDVIEEVQERRETIVSLLIDLSCSMQVDDRYRLAYMIADCMSNFLTKGEVPTEIVGHTTTSEVIPNVIGRNRPIHYVLFKTREEPHNLTTEHRLCSILHTGMHYFSYDGEATMWCYERLKKSRAKHRIMFVVTDGDPSGTYLSKKGDDISYFTARHFRDVVAFIEAESNVDIVGVSIKSDISRTFSRSVRIDSIEDIYRKLSPFALDLLRESYEKM